MLRRCSTLESSLTGRNRSTTSSARGCYLCSPYILLPKCPGWTPRKVGGADGIRTHDLLDAIEARSQLRHGPTGLQLLNAITGRFDTSRRWLPVFSQFLLAEQI